MRIILATLAVALFASSTSANAASASWRCEFYSKSRSEFGPSNPDFMLNKTEDVCTSD
jgi:hypothetical protein